MAENDVLVERDGAVAILTLNRPAVHNALNGKVLARLGALVDDLEAEGSVNAVVLTGAGERSFCAGADLDELAGLDTVRAKDALRLGQGVMDRVARSRVPFVAAVNGLALGGGFELVLATTFPVLADHASLGLPEAGLGLIPGYGGTQRLPRVVGRPAAAHLMLTGERMSAERAYQLGVTPVSPVPQAELLDTALGLARTVAARGPRAVGAILEALGTTSPTRHELDLETTLAATASGSKEAVEGIAAFKERRPARFAHRDGTPPDPLTMTGGEPRRRA